MRWINKVIYVILSSDSLFPCKEKDMYAQLSLTDDACLLATSSQLSSNVNNIEIQNLRQMLWDFPNGACVLTDGRVISRWMEYDKNPNHLIVFAL